MYGGDPVVWIDVLGYEKFANRVLTCKKGIQIHTLPPTAEIAAHQSLHVRAFFQIQTLIGVEDIDPCDFGWSIVNEKLMPIKTAK